MDAEKVLVWLDMLSGEVTRTGGRTLATDAAALIRSLQSQLADHARELLAYQTTVENLEARLAAAEAERDALRADERRMDWLADTKNAIGQVLLPTECVTNNVHSLRAAIDAAMALDNAREAQEVSHD